MSAPESAAIRLGNLKLAGEDTCLAALKSAFALDTDALERVERDAFALSAQIRELMPKRLGVETFLAEYRLSSEEGVALMCLAEALLRIPDTATIDALLDDKLGDLDWDDRLGRSASLMVNASTWGLALTGRLLEWGETNPTNALNMFRRVLGRIGQPVARQAIRTALRLMGQQFVFGESIEAALRRVSDQPAHHRFSFDMLGEAALSAADADRFAESYAQAIAALATTRRGDRPAENDGISIKLSALHPRYEEAQRARVMKELLPTLASLARSAREAALSFTIDAEEADRLVLSLDLLERLARDPALDDWDGLGLAVQAYQKRAVATIDWLDDLARDTRRRFMVRLVKGAYWDSEIKSAQERGLSDYPVFTRKPVTDLSYRAAAARILKASDRLYGQFATHNPRTVLEVLAMASSERRYEFQKLHGMGDVLYELIAERLAPDHRVRVYAPVGAHDELLPYLVRRLLENGANTSFVHQVVDESLPLERIVTDPDRLLTASGRPVPRPALLFPDRVNSTGLDLSDRAVLDALVARIKADRAAVPQSSARREPADHDVPLDSVVENDVADVADAVAHADAAFVAWSRRTAIERATILETASDLFERERVALISVIVREGGRTLPDALAEMREAIDFLRYYAARARTEFSGPMRLPGPTGERNTITLGGRGVFACISPWNFPLAIFTGQVAAALAAGNTVIAKPAEQTPLTAARAVALMHDAGVPRDALALICGEGATVGAALVGDPRIAGVAFTGSTETAKLIQRALGQVERPIVPFIAETGGINAMIVDSSALVEQVTRDVTISAFNSAGQRCSALRVLYLQREIADAVEEKLAGALAELELGDPADPATDVGPVIDDDAMRMLAQEADAMLSRGQSIGRAPVSPALKRGWYVAPVAIEVAPDDAPTREIFGPILPIVRYDADELDAVLARIRATGYALTLGIHSRITAFQRHVADALPAGNIYVNRSMIGAVVGVQPFGGSGLSGTGPKAGLPYYLHRFARETTLSENTAAIGGDLALMAKTTEGAEAT